MAPGMVADRPPARANWIGQTGRNSFAEGTAGLPVARYSNRVRRPFARPRGGDQEDRPDAKETGAQELVAQVDTGARHPGGVPGKLLFGVHWRGHCSSCGMRLHCRSCSASGVFNNTEARSIHLAFAFFLAFTAFPAFRRSPRDHVPIQDWGLPHWRVQRGIHRHLLQ